MSKSATVANSSDVILNDSREYAIYVCSNRAIPAVEDGLKTGQRIALWLLRNRADKIKTVALGGEMAASKLYVHGDVSANDSIGKLAAPYNNNIPLIEGLGQFGNRVAPIEGIGAPRYTEVRRAKSAEAFLYNDLDLIPLEENYDGSNYQPQHFLPLIPTVLLNGVSGIAVGWSTEILPRSLKSLIQATQDALEGKPVKTLVPHYEKFDVGVKSTGLNQWEFTGKLKILDTSTIQITELPPGEPIDRFRAKLIQLEDSGQIQGFTDRSTKVIDITVKFKRGSLGAQTARVEVEEIDGRRFKTKIPARKAWTEEDAIKFFKLTEKVTERIVVVDWGGKTIRTYPSAELLVTDFVKWRLGWYTKRFEKRLKDTNYELNYWLTLRALFKDQFTQRLGKFINRAAVEDDVTKVVTKAKLSLDSKQMDRVVSLPTYRWTKDFEAEVERRIAELQADIKEYKAILASPERLKGVFNGELEDLKKLKFG